MYDWNMSLIKGYPKLTYPFHYWHILEKNPTTPVALKCL